jgi:hypothetical protein
MCKVVIKRHQERQASQETVIILHLFLFLFPLFRSIPLCSDVLDLLRQLMPSHLAPPYVFDHTYLT